MPRLLTGTFTTAAFVRSSFRQFEASPYRAAPKGPPSSSVQQNAFASWAVARTLGAFAPWLATALVTLYQRAAQDRLERGQLT